MNRRTFARTLLAGTALAPRLLAHPSQEASRPPGRDPTPEEQEAVRAFLARHEERMTPLRLLPLPGGVFPALPPAPPSPARSRRDSRG